MAEREMAGHQPSREIHLSLSVEGVEQGGADDIGIGGQGVEFIAAVARNASWRHIKIAGKVKRHRSVKNAAHRREGAAGAGVPDPLEHLVDGIGVSEYVMSRFPVGVLVGIAEASHPD